MTDYNSKNQNRSNHTYSKVRQLDDLYEYDVYDTAESDPHTASGSARSSRQGSVRRPASSARPNPARSGAAGNAQGVRRSASSSNRKLFRKRKKKFKKLLLCYIAVLVVILIIGSVIFSIYLSSYENSQPSHLAESIVKSYSSQQGIIDFISSNAEHSDLIGNVDEITQMYATNIAGKSVSYKENNDFRPDTPSYDIIAEGKTVAKVTLAAQGSGWKVSDLDLAQYLPDTATISIDAPAGATVSVNGMVLDSSYITASSVPAILENSLNFIKDPPSYDTYEISGIVSDPQVQVTSSDGKALELSKNENQYTAIPETSADFIASVQDRVYDTIDNYATYFIHMSFGLANYIVYGSDLYSSIFGSEDMDPIDTNLYNWEQIDHYEFAERSADNFVQYSDDCFTVDIKYALDMYFTDPTFSDNNQKMDATWVFVIEPLDGSWCISDIITH